MTREEITLDLGETRHDGGEPAGGVRPLLWLAALVWLPLGRVFHANVSHFGWGMLPSIVWHGSLPVLAVAFALVAAAEGRRRRPASTAVWLVLAVVYGALFAASRLHRADSNEDPTFFDRVFLGDRADARPSESFAASNVAVVEREQGLFLRATIRNTAWSPRSISRLEASISAGNAVVLECTTFFHEPIARGKPVALEAKLSCDREARLPPGASVALVVHEER